jgi:hypothetical protein
MKDKTRPTRYSSRADEVRRIAQDIYDKKERRILMRFVAEYENLSKKKQNSP